MFYLGKLLEAVGCADVGFALWYGITQPHSMTTEFELAGVGILVFLIGYVADHSSRAGS